MSKKIRIFLCIAFTGMCLHLHAQDRGDDNWGAWYMYFGTNKISEKWSIHTEAQFRFYEITSNFNQLLLRTGVNYHISPKAIATLGYGFIDTDTDFMDQPGEEKLKEHRIFEQFILKNNLGKFAFEHRYRFEQRFLHRYDESETQHRARYRLQITYPLGTHWFLNAYDEIFINLQEPVFGQNRLYGAVGYKVNKDLSFQFGYLKNHFTGINFDRLQLAVFFNTDFLVKNNK
ncbi:DUF2490 domain-containing protein [Robertkochia solimangrovi]|uniref:DUF2490 domain-containing protein n=1 Tax=Robertkochia solimangrovi TaxID=2213046 RepID=UPI0011806CFA|nr:DUF2490 domain-containing protein [Robertkochia solimangrovi]TRZ43710.1 DUF2490 domain-containing protein [Robertkochia solimangrovi]